MVHCARTADNVVLGARLGGQPTGPNEAPASGRAGRKRAGALKGTDRPNRAQHGMHAPGHAQN
eukprot:6827349-Alexandrium_andersonii.AAC.1